MSIKTILPLAVLAVAAAVSTTALAQQANMNFNGEIQTQACGPASSIQGGNTVTLPTIPASNFTFAGQTAGQTMFTFVLSDCTIAANRRLKVGFWSPNATAEGRLSNPSGSNVQIELLPAATAGGTTPSTNRINVGTGTYVANTADPGQFATTATVNINYFAQYYANTVPVTGGTVNIPAQWIVYY